MSPLRRTVVDGWPFYQTGPLERFNEGWVGEGKRIKMASYLS